MYGGPTNIHQSVKSYDAHGQNAIGRGHVYCTVYTRVTVDTRTTNGITQLVTPVLSYLLLCIHSSTVKHLFFVAVNFAFLECRKFAQF